MNTSTSVTHREEHHVHITLLLLIVDLISNKPFIIKDSPLLNFFYLLDLPTSLFYAHRSSSQMLPAYQ